MKPRRVFAGSIVVIAATSHADPTPERHWKVTVDAHHRCIATEVGGKAVPYTCDAPMTIVKPEGSTECFEEGRHRGNPPAPAHKVRCPR